MAKTERITCAPEEIDCHSPGRRDYHVLFEHPSIWGFYRVPVTVIVGPEAEDEKGVVAIGSVHGDEYEGPVAIKNLTHSLARGDVRGRVILIPVLNVAAFKTGTRDTMEDGVNLNRTFPGATDRTVTYKFSDFVTRQIFPHCHVVLDLHAGGRVMKFLPFPSFHADVTGQQRRQTEDLARGFGCQLTSAYHNMTPGLLVSTAEALGKITVGAELGFGQSIGCQGVQAAHRGMIHAMVKSGVLDSSTDLEGGVDRESQILIDSSVPGSGILADFTGHMEPLVDVGASLRKGDCIARLHNFERIDASPLEVLAPYDGIVAGLPTRAKVMEGQMVVMMGKVIEWMA